MNDTKRQVLPVGLWVVATPIGNLGDITERARNALTEASLIFCEDTRRTTALLSALRIPHTAKLVRLDAHTPVATISAWVEKLVEGSSFALVTDAGTPGISDPGAHLVRLARAAGIAVVPLPGASAVVTLLSVTGFQDTAFQFRGFFPRKTSERKAELTRAMHDADFCRIFVWFESPFRILETVTLIQEMCATASLTLAKELTKIHETLFVGTATEALTWLQSEIEREGTLGEWALAVEFARVDRAPGLVKRHDDSDGGWEKALECLLSCGVSVSQSAQKVSHFFGISRKISYARALEFSDQNKN